MLRDRFPVCPACNVGVLWPNGWMDQNATWYGGRPQPMRHCIRWGPSSPSPKGGRPQLLACVCGGQTAGWIKMPLGMEVGLSPGDIVLDGDRAPGEFHVLPGLEEHLTTFDIQCYTNVHFLIIIGPNYRH